MYWVEKGLGYSQEVLDEMPIEVNESQVGLNVGLQLWSGPFSDSSDLNRIHQDLVLWYYQAQVLNPFLLELVLLRSKAQFVFY